MEIPVVARQMIRGGSPVDIPTAAEVADAVDARARALAAEARQVEQARELEYARGFKWMRLPQLTGTPASSAVLIDEKGNGPVGPEQGYAWSLKRVIVDGMTAGAVPDVINMFRNSHIGQPPLWQFNGNTFGYTFGKLEIVLLSGDFLKFASVGTFAATGVIRVTGELIELPAEMLAKLA
jgi:hypothetical protein